MRLISILLAALSAVVLGGSQVNESEPPDKITFRIVTDKSVYSHHSQVLVKFLIANTGLDSIYGHRSLTACESLYGYFHFQIRDKNGLDMQEWMCSSEDIWPGMQTTDPVSELQSRNWVEVRPGEIFGFQEHFDVPSAGGTYRLKAELVPPRNFSAHQKEILEQKQMRILSGRHEAPLISITVK